MQPHLQLFARQFESDAATSLTKKLEDSQSRHSKSGEQKLTTSSKEQQVYRHQPARLIVAAPTSYRSGNLAYYDEFLQPSADKMSLLSRSSRQRRRSNSNICSQCKRPTKRHTYEEELHCIYKEVCETGTHELSRYRVMIVGHFGAGKTSIKRSLLNEEFINQHIPTQGISLGNECHVDVTDAVGWKRGRPSFTQRFLTLLPDKVSWARSPLNRTVTTGCFDPVLRAVRIFTSGQEPGGDDPEAESLDPRLPSTVVDCVKDVLDSDTGEKKEGHHFSLWDFGGQRGYYIMHQLFLNRQAAYLLVMDGTKKLDSIVDSLQMDRAGDMIPSPMPQKAGEFADFWLKSIYSLVERCEDSNGQPKVIIVVTKADLMSQSAIKEYKESLQQHLCGKAYHNIVYGHPIFVDNTKKEDPGIRQLRSRLVQLAKDPSQEHLSSLGSQYYTRWLLLLELIHQRRGEWNEHPVMNVEKFQTLARNTIIGKSDATEFLKRHDAFGDLLHFKEKHLKDMVITDPQWLINMISPIFTPSILKGTHGLDNTAIDMLAKHGKLSEAFLNKLQRSGHAKGMKIAQLVKLLMTFELIVPFCDTKDGKRSYIVPFLLKPVKPGEVKPSDAAPAIGFTFYTEETRDNRYIPHGLFPRLVSRCWASDSHWELIGNPAYDYVQFRTHQWVARSELILIGLHLVNNSIRVIAHRVKHANGGQGTMMQNDQEKGDILATARAILQKALSSIIQQVFPQLENQLKTFIWCGCVCEKEDERQLIEVGMEGQKLHEHKFDHLVCDRHVLTFSIKAYRHWFAKLREEACPEDSNEPILGIEIQPDPHPLQKLQKYEGRVYELVHRNRGRVLIINNVNFKATAPGMKLEDRHGSDFDAMNLQNLFKALGFTVATEEDQTAGQIRDLMRKEARNPQHRDADAYFMWILSHGTEGIVYGADGKAVNIDWDITHHFTQASCRNLTGKPKVFFFQCCRGHEAAEAAMHGHVGEPQTKDKGTGDMEASRPSADTVQYSGQNQSPSQPVAAHPAGDMLLVFANIIGYESYRYADKGTRLVRAFVQEVCRSAHEKELVEILSDVDRRLRQPRHVNDTIQGLEWHNRSFKKFYFFPGHPRKGPRSERST